MHKYADHSLEGGDMFNEGSHIFIIQNRLSSKNSEKKQKSWNLFCLEAPVKRLSGFMSKSQSRAARGT